MKIAFFAGGFHGGGAEGSTISLANEFDRKGHLVYIIVKKGEGPLVSSVAKNVEIVDLDARADKIAAFRLAAVIKKKKFDVLVSGTPNINMTASLAKMLSPFSTTKIVLVERINFRDFSKLQPSIWNKILLPWLYPKADRVVTLSESLRDVVIHDLKCDPGKVVTIPNGFALSQIVHGSRQGTDHAWLEDKSMPVVVSAGRLRPIKGYDTLLEAFATLRSRRACRLIIVGEGSELERLRARSRELGIQEDVCFVGFQLNPFAFIGRADLFVVSSKSEAFSRVLVEAMACGVPVVSTDCGGPGEILQGGRYGRLVPVGDVSALAAAIEATLDEPVDRAVVRERANDFSIEKVADSYLEMFWNMGIGKAPLS